MLYQALTKVRAGGGKETVKSIPVVVLGRKLPELHHPRRRPRPRIPLHFDYEYEYEMEKTRFRPDRPKSDYGSHIEIGTVLAGGASVHASRTIRLAISLR